MSNFILPASCCCIDDEEEGSRGDLMPCECFDATHIPVCMVPREMCGKLFIVNGVCYTLVCNYEDTTPGCKPGERVFGLLGAIPTDSCDSKFCCDPEPPDDPCEYDFATCCDPDSIAGDFSFTLNCSGGFNKSAGCQCVGGSEDNFSECYEESTFNENIGANQQTPECDTGEGAWLRCASLDKCGTLSNVGNTDSQLVFSPPLRMIQNCDAVDEQCCDSGWYITDSLECSQMGFGGPYTNPQSNCPKGCSSWGCNHLGYDMAVNVSIPCKELTGSSDPTIFYEGAGGLTVPLLEMGHFCEYGGISHGNCFPPVCFFGGTPNQAWASWSVGHQEVQEILGIWTAEVSFDRQSTCQGKLLASVTFTPDNQDDLGGEPYLKWEIPPSEPIENVYHPCGGGSVRGVFNWATQIWDETQGSGPFDSLDMVEEFLQNCGPGSYVPMFLNATDTTQSNTILSEFFNLWDPADPQKILATKLAAFREAITTFNVYGPNADPGIRQSLGFNGCFPAGIRCDSCTGMIYKAGCDPVHAKISNRFTFGY